MAELPTIYDLMLMLSPSASDDARAQVLSDVEGAISGAGGAVERRDDWGRRPLTFKIRHETEAFYHLVQFSGEASLLESLSHSLGINDTVLRFRIIKVLPGTPPPPESPPPVIASSVAHGSTSQGATPPPAVEAEPDVEPIEA
jgi:small subunit ribosomal protein S6